MFFSWVSVGCAQGFHKLCRF